MTGIDIFAEFPAGNGPSPDYPYCPLTDHTSYLMDVEDGQITLNCTTCHKRVDPDLLDAFATSSEIPVTVEFDSVPGDGWEFGPEFSGTIAPRDGAEQLRTERDELQAKLTAAMKTIAVISTPTIDLIRYLPGNDSAGRLAIWCTDCLAEDATHSPFWTEDDAAEQVTELCLANLVAIAEEHERQHHADKPTPSSCTAEFSDHTCTCLTADVAEASPQ